jgi:hypothetical protein
MKGQVPFPLSQEVYKDCQLIVLFLTTAQMTVLTELFLTPLALQRVLKWEQPMGATDSNIYPFTGDMTGKRQNFALHINKDSTPYSVSMLYFAAVIALLVEDTDAINST